VLACLRANYFNPQSSSLVQITGRVEKANAEHLRPAFILPARFAGLIANKKWAQRQFKNWHSSVGKKYLPPTTTTNGVNTSHAIMPCL